MYQQKTIFCDLQPPGPECSKRLFLCFSLVQYSTFWLLPQKIGYLTAIFTKAAQNAGESIIAAADSHIALRTDIMMQLFGATSYNVFLKLCLAHFAASFQEM